jgi:lipoprotein signal peptidase
MAVFALVTLLVPALDQALKRWVRRRLAPGPISLGVIGELRLVEGRIWITRTGFTTSLSGLWTIWVAGACVSVAIGAIVPAAAWALGLLVGGALSHALETTLHGTISDFVCLRFWPAFNLADVALTVGALGVVFTMIVAG